MRARSALGAHGLDMRLSLRMLLRHPGLTAVAVIALSVGIPVGLIPFHMAHVMTRALPFEDGERIVRLRDEALGANTLPLSDFAVWREELTAVQELGASSTESRNVVTDDGRAAPAVGSAVTASTFEIVRVSPLLGRRLVEADERQGAPDVVVLGYDLWRSRFGGDPGILGRTVRLGSEPHEVVGVMPEDFLFPWRDQFWVPLRWAQASGGPGQPSVAVFGRLAEGVSLERANAEAEAIGRRLAAVRPDGRRPLRARIVPYTGEGIYDQPAFWSASFLALMLLTTACGNVGVLILARTAARTGEIAVRTALGASRARIVMQLFLEALALALLGTGAGLVLLDLAAHRLQAMLPQEYVPFWYDYTLTGRTTLVALGLAAFSATLAGVVPALRATGRDVQRSLQRAGSAGIRFGTLSTVLVLAEVAVGTTFLSLAGRALPAALQDLEEGMGIVPSEFLVATLQIPWGARTAREGLPGRERAQTELRSAREELLRRLRAEPGFGGATVASALPGERHPSRGVEVEGGGGTPHRVRYAAVDVDFFRTLERPVLQGRDFIATDVGLDSAAVATSVLVNRAFVARVLQGGNPLGRRFREVGDRGGEPGPWKEIVGVVGRLGMTEAGQPDEPGYYAPASVERLGGRLLVNVAGSDVSVAVETLRRIAAEADPDVMVLDPMSLERHAKLGPWFGAFWRGVFFSSLAGLAMVLSGAGLYALVSFTVSGRRREIGIRTALGARTGDIVATLARRPFLQLTVGVLAGLALHRLVVLKFELGRSGGMDRLSEPALLTLAAGAILAVGFAACVPPIVRGMRTRPADVLNEVPW